MRNFESGSFDFYSNREKPSGGERERASELDDIDLRPESEVFQDHERIDSKDLDDQLIALRDQLSKDTGGIIHIDIPAYRYDFADNPSFHVSRDYCMRAAIAQIYQRGRAGGVY